MLQSLSRLIVNAITPVLLFFSFLIAKPCISKTYYVSDAGNDLNAGSFLLPWKTIARVNKQHFKPGDSILFKRNETFRGNLIANSGSSNAYIFYGDYGEGNKPLLLGSINRSQKTDWINTGNNLWQTADVFLTGTSIAVDAGNIIFNNEQVCGWKQSAKELLYKQGDFFSDIASATVILYSVDNPAKFYTNIEIALKRNGIEQSFRGFVIYKNLDVRYTAAHGIGGITTNNIIIQDMDFSYIGGGYHEGLIRYGNGVEFYNNANNNIVERCRFNQVYDVAVTPQGDLDNYKVYNIIFRNNIITNCEQAFEFWIRGSNAEAQHIYFTNNICLNAGATWAHPQRDQKLSAHLLFWGSDASYSNIYVCNNIFGNSLNAAIFEGSDKLHNLQFPEIIINKNCWYINDSTKMLATVIGWNNSFLHEPLLRYRTISNYIQQTGQDIHSSFKTTVAPNDLQLLQSLPCLQNDTTMQHLKITVHTLSNILTPPSQQKF